MVPVIETYHPHLVSPGYFFHAPFEKTVYGSEIRRVYIPGQFGPHIYDSNGVRPFYISCTVSVALTSCGVIRNSFGVAHLRSTIVKSSTFAKQNIMVPTPYL